jgi:hypothetical protein
MATRAIQCPGCRAADTSDPDAHGIHTCAYCGMRYQVGPTSGPAAVEASARPPNAAVMAIVASTALISILGVVVAVVLSGSDEEAATQARHRTSSAPSEPGVSATAEFELHGTRSGRQGTFYVLGYVKNTSPFPIRKPKITIVLRDEEGKEVRTKDGFGEDDVVEPGGRTAASVLVKDPPDHASFTVEVAPRRSDGVSNAVSGLEVEAGEATPGSASSLDIAGRVHHRGSEPARFVRVRVLGFDSDDKLLGIYSSYVDGDRLEPGGSARFSVRNMRFDSEPARYELQVSGRVAD